LRDNRRCLGLIELDILFTNVIGRYTVDYPLEWTDALGEMCFRCSARAL
jgi:hypothetical protein